MGRVSPSRSRLLKVRDTDRCCTASRPEFNSNLIQPTPGPMLDNYPQQRPRVHNPPPNHHHLSPQVAIIVHILCRRPFLRIKIHFTAEIVMWIIHFQPSPPSSLRHTPMRTSRFLILLPLLYLTPLTIRLCLGQNPKNDNQTRTKFLRKALLCRPGSL